MEYIFLYGLDLGKDTFGHCPFHFTIWLSTPGRNQKDYFFFKLFLFSFTFSIPPKMDLKYTKISFLNH